MSKEAIVEVHNPQGVFYSNLFLVPKKDRGRRPVIDLKALNSFVQTEHFKMEGTRIHTLKDLKRSCQSGGLVGDGGSKVCIFRNPNASISPSIPQTRIPKKMLSILMPPIWPVISSLGLYQDLEASTSSPSGDGGM